MITANIDSVSNTPIRENGGVESVVDWFDQHKQSFYMLGWCYLKNQPLMLELFYRTILKVQKELPRFKNGTSFNVWVTSIFIHTCWELSIDESLQVREESEQHKDLFNAFEHLKKEEKDAVLLTYLKGFSQEETAHLLQIPFEKLKENMSSGIQSLRQCLGFGAQFNGCKQYQKNYKDYLERNLERTEKIDFEIHIYHCQDCQEDLGAFQDVMLTLLNLPEWVEAFHVPADFMDMVKARLAEKEKHRKLKSKKRLRIGIFIASIFAILIAIEILTGTFTNLYYTYTERDPQLRTFLKHNLGERLNLEKESNGVKIRIKSVIADDDQTLIFYEIEDTAEAQQYVIDYYEGLSVGNLHELMTRERYQRYYPPDLNSELNTKGKNVFKGKISLLPLNKNKGTIKLKITKLQKLVRDSKSPNGFSAYENPENKTGNWNFEIPVTKQPSINYELREETKVDGVPVRFNKLTIAPTATILQYSINNEGPEKRIGNLNFANLEVNNKKINVDRYSNTFSNQDAKWITFQIRFDPLFEEKPKKVKVQLESAQLYVEDPKTIELDATGKYPQTFEYAGSTISIDKVEVGNPSNVVISNFDIKNRTYESLQFLIKGEAVNEDNPMEIDADGVIVDKNGVKYDMKQIPVPYEEIEQPRYFFTVQRIKIHSIDGKKVIPKKLEISGYNKTINLNEAVELLLK